MIINGKEISPHSPVYFIADIASNHDGDLERAKKLIWLAKKAGADAVKFQHFIADKIVSDVGFKKFTRKISHQANWNESVFEIYKKYECDRDWIPELYETAMEADIDFFSTPYDYEAVDILYHYVSAYKIGSGDITWINFLEYIANKEKPILIATGSSTAEDVERAVQAIKKYNNQCAILQCNTNYTGLEENYKYINLNVLKYLSEKYPEVVLGLSDHTPGYVVVLGAITLGARIIEKHFTDDNKRTGPDHPFSLTPEVWENMVKDSRKIESALGNGVKIIEDNETETVIIQRRCIRLDKNKNAGEIIQKEDLVMLRPAPEQSIPPYEVHNIIGKRLLTSKLKGELITYSDIE